MNTAIAWMMVLAMGVLGAVVGGVFVYETCHPGGYGNLFECEERALSGCFLGFVVGLSAGLVLSSRART